MKSFKDFNIDIQQTDSDESRGPSPQVYALLQELKGHLQDYLQTGQSSGIDVRSLPMTPNDYKSLKEILGRGEVNAKLDCLGKSEIYETEIPGVWWLTHYNEKQEILTEVIEVTELPAILRTQMQDLCEAEALLNERLAELFVTDETVMDETVTDKTVAGKKPT